MLTEARRRIAQATVGVAEPHRWSHHPDAPLGGMVDPREHVYLQQGASSTGNSASGLTGPGMECRPPSACRARTWSAHR